MYPCMLYALLFFKMIDELPPHVDDKLKRAVVLVGVVTAVYTACMSMNACKEPSEEQMTQCFTDRLVSLMPEMDIVLKVLPLRFRLDGLLYEVCIKAMFAGGSVLAIGSCMWWSKEALTWMAQKFFFAPVRNP